MIYTDGVHLISDVGEFELHNFAIRVGLKKEWYQDKKYPHYDITTRKMLARVKGEGAIKVSSKTLLKLLKARIVREVKEYLEEWLK